MKSVISVFLAGIATTIFSVSALAQNPQAGDAPANRASRQPMDCAKAKDKARCESLNKKIEVCKDKTDDDWRNCMGHAGPAAKFSPPKARDCAKARNKERCEAHTVALADCKDMATRTEHRKCMAERLQVPKKD